MVSIRWRNYLSSGVEVDAFQIGKRLEGHKTNRRAFWDIPLPWKKRRKNIHQKGPTKSWVPPAVWVVPSGTAGDISDGTF